MYGAAHFGLAPWLLAATIPLIIHLLTKRTRRKMELPTLKFLQKTLASQSQIWRHRHWLTMLLRTMAVAALVLAFIRPSRMSAFAAHPGERAGVVIILDVSESMAYSEGSSSDLEEAKSQVRQILETLHAGDRVNVVLCGASQTLAQESPTEDVGALQRVVEAVKPGDERADASGALGLAVEQIGKMNTGVRRLYVVSDFQRTNWSEVRFEAVPGDVNVLFDRVGTDGRNNLGLTGLRLRPIAPRMGETATLQAEVFNAGPAPRTVPVEIALSDGRHFNQDVQVGPYSSGNVSFGLTFDRPEKEEVTARIPSDSLPADDVRRLSVDLQQEATVILLTDEDLDATSSAAFYLYRALNPDPSSHNGFRVLPIHPRELNNPLLSAADAVIVCNAPSMPEVQYQALARYLTRGGNLLWMLYGDRLQAELTGLGANLPKSDPTPLTVQSVEDLQGKGKGYLNLSEARYESPLLKAFRNLPSGGLSRAKFYRFCITSEVSPKAEVLLKYEDGTAACVRAEEGSGNLLLVNMSPAPAWSDLARQEFFVPLIHEFLKGIMEKNLVLREFNPGGPASATIAPTGGSLICRDPNGDSIPVNQDKTTGSVVIDKTKGVGFYRIYSGSDEVALFSVNPHPDESDLRSIDPRELESKRERQVELLGIGAGALNVASILKDIELWPYLLAAATLFLILEQVVRRVRIRPVSAVKRS